MGDTDHIELANFHVADRIVAEGVSGHAATFAGTQILKCYDRSSHSSRIGQRGSPRQFDRRRARPELKISKGTDNTLTRLRRDAYSPRAEVNVNITGRGTRA